MITHPIAPVFDERSKILILGSFPSVKSREQSFFYGHPQNRFWKVISEVFEKELPRSIDEKRKFLLENQIAVWDVIGECEIKGSSDASIKSVKSNDLSVILDNSAVTKIFVNGKTAEKYYKRYIEKSLGIKAILLPSTSPANAVFTLEKLIEAWSVIIDR